MMAGGSLGCSAVQLKDRGADNKKAVIRRLFMKSVAHPAGIEPTTPAFGGQYSIH